MDSTLQQVCILGSTGSIGTNTLDVLSRHRDRFCVHSLSAHSRVEALFEQCVHWRPRHAAVAQDAHATWLRERLAAEGIDTRVHAGERALAELAAAAEV